MDRTDVPVVQTVGLTKVFKDFWRRNRVAAVNDLNLEIRRGEVFGLLGPNGSGKSTTIKMLLGLLYPTRGRISVFGRPPTDVATKARIGFLPEESYLYRFLDARETLDLYGRIFKLHGQLRKERIDTLLDMVGLQAEAKRRMGEYSKGMARRIGLAQALINDPELLILDEPTAGLDPIGIRQIKDVIRALSSKGKTILLSSHLLADVEDVCDRVTIMYGGCERAAGTIDELLRQEDRTQITTEKLSPDTIEKVGELVDRLENKKVLNVGAPSDRLETFFMKTVERAQAANVASSGARAGGKLPEFLGATEPPDVIESLMAAGATQNVAPSKPVSPQRKQRRDKAKRDVLDQLTKPKSAPPEPKAAEAEGPADESGDRPIAPEGDRGVIDALIDARRDKPGE